MLICTYMDMDVMIHQKTNSLKKLNKLANLIKTYAIKLISQSPIYSWKLVRSLVGGWKHGILYKKIWKKNIKF
jgi:hypothetical protein